MTGDLGIGRGDRGAATLLVLAVGLVLVAAGVAGAAVGAARVGRHEARTAADLGALAGAQRAVEGQPVACAAAARFVTANGAVLISCTVRNREIVVQVAVPVAGRSARAAARAGPVTPAGVGRTGADGAAAARAGPVTPPGIGRTGAPVRLVVPEFGEAPM